MPTPSDCYAHAGEALLAGQRALGIPEVKTGVSRRPRRILAYATTPAWVAWGGDDVLTLAGGLEVAGYVVQTHGEWVYVYDVEQVDSHP